MAIIQSLTKYKKSKLIVKELVEVNKILRSTIKALLPYNKYTPVKNILSYIVQEKVILDLHLKKQKEIFASKGLEKNNES